MDVLLDCPEEQRFLMTEFLARRGLRVVDGSAECLVAERGRVLPEDYPGIAILYRPDRLESFDKLLKELASFRDQSEGGALGAGFIVGQNADCFELIRNRDVCFFRAEDERVFCVLAGGREFEVKQKLYELEKRLQRRGFVRISKSHIVNLLAVNEIVPWLGGRILLRLDATGGKLEVSRSYVKQFKAALGMS